MYMGISYEVLKRLLEILNSHKWMLDVKPRITKLQSTVPEKEVKRGTPRKTHMEGPRKGNNQIS